MSGCRVVVKIKPESDEFCDGCQLLKGLNFAQCLAGFAPRFEDLKAVRPKECLEAVATIALVGQYLGTWSQHE